MKPSIAVATLVTRSKASLSIPQGILPGYSVFIITTRKSTFTVEVFSNKRRYSRSISWIRSCTRTTKVCAAVLLWITSNITPKMSARHPMCYGDAMKIVWVNRVCSCFKCFWLIILVSSHSATNISVDTIGWELEWCTSTISSPSTCCLPGASIFDCTKTSWTGVASCSVKIGNPCPVAIFSTLSSVEFGIQYV